MAQNLYLVKILGFFVHRFFEHILKILSSFFLNYYFDRQNFWHPLNFSLSAYFFFWSPSCFSTPGPFQSFPEAELAFVSSTSPPPGPGWEASQIISFHQKLKTSSTHHSAALPYPLPSGKKLPELPHQGCLLPAVLREHFYAARSRLSVFLFLSRGLRPLCVRKCSRSWKLNPLERR